MKYFQQVKSSGTDGYPIYKSIAVAVLLFLASPAGAALQITLHEVILEGQSAVTNVVTKSFDTEVWREDGPEASLLVFPKKSETVALDHLHKTFVRSTNSVAQATNPSTSTPGNLESRPFPPDGKPALAVTWNNAQTAGCFWMDHEKQRYASPLVSRLKAAGGLPSFVSAGWVHGTNLVIGTEYRTLVPVSSGSGSTQMVALTQHSTLTGLIETNLDSTLFQIPIGYRDATGEERRTFGANPDLFGNRVREMQQIDGLRRAYQQGRPSLEATKEKFRN
jgi:hypothetical protein